jgi:protein TonB
LPKVSVLEEDKIFTHVEIDASFQRNGGWAGFVKTAIESNMDELVAEGRTITCRVSFTVSKDGTVIDVQALTMKDSKLAQIAVDAIKKAPKWTPAQQNGHYVNVYREQEITFNI